MAVPWLRALNMAIDLVDLVKSRKAAQRGRARAALVERGPETLDPADPILTRAVDAAVREALSRDTRGLELERERLDAERRRAERAARLETVRQAGERELGRLRLLTAVAVASWAGTLLAAVRVASGPVGARVAVGGAWAFLLAAIVVAFSAQARVTDLMARLDEGGSVQPDAMRGLLAQMALAFVIAGLAVAGLAVLV